MEPLSIAIYIFIGILVSLFIDMVSLSIGGLGLTNWHRSLWILCWPLVVLYLWLLDDE